MSNISKAQAVRDYIAKHPNAKPREVSTALSGQGVEVNASYVSKVKAKTTKAKISTRKSKAKSAKRKATGHRGRSVRPYPSKTLEEALLIPEAIRRENNANPRKTEDHEQASVGVSKIIN